MSFDGATDDLGSADGPRFAAALSEHPLATHAIGEVVGHVAEVVGEEPDVAVLFVTGPLTGVLEDMVNAVHALLRPKALIGTTAVSVIASNREAEEVPAVALWAGRIDGARAVRISSTRTGEGIVLDGFDPGGSENEGTLVLLADPFTFPVDGFLSDIKSRYPAIKVVGGLSSAARGPGGNRLVCDQEIHDSGAVGLLLSSDVAVSFAVSQGCRPVGQPLTVTGSDRNHLTGLGGRPAMERLQELLAGASDEDRELMQQGLHIGVVHDERKLDFDRGDFLIRAVMGVDQQEGSVVVGDLIPVGATVQFQVRDSASAAEDLREVFQHRRAEAALAFTCNGRGARLFGEPNHDARVISEALSNAPLAGMFCAGEIGPVGADNHTHGYTASVLLFH